MAVLVQALYETLVGAQTEIIFFAIAVCAHVLLFGKYRIIGPPKAKSATVAREGRPTESGKGALLDVDSIKSLVRQRAGRSALAAALEKQLAASAASKEEACRALVEVLESDAKTSNAALLGAVRDVVSSGSAALGSRLAEALLRGHLSQGSLGDFECVLSMAEDANEVKPSTAVLAVRACLKSSDLERALKCLRRFAPLLKEGLNAAAASAPQGLLQELIRLAGQSAKLPALARELHGCSLLAASTLEALLAACVKRRDSAALQEIEDFSRAKAMKFSGAAYGWLIRGSREPKDAARLLAEAGGHGHADQELLLAAAECAHARGDAALAATVVGRLPAELGPELALAALRLHAKMPSLEKDPGGAILGLFERRPPGATVLDDAASAQAVVDAALRGGRADLLAQLLSESPVGPRHVGLLKRFGAAGNLRAAREVFGACKEKTGCLYNTMLDICIDCKDMEGAEKLMSEAVAADVADVVTYNTLIKKLLQCGDSERARAVIETMRAAGGPLTPNSVTFNEFIDAVIRSNLAAAWQLVDEMKACGLNPTSVTASILLKSVQKSSKAAEVEQTLALVNGMQDEMDEVLLSSVCEACIRAGRADLLQKHLRRQRGSKAVPVTGAHTFGSLIRAYGFVQDLEGARQAWREMRARKIVPTSITVGCMVEALACNGDPEAGHRLIRELLADAETQPLVNSVMYGSVVKGLSQQRSFDRVWELYAEMATEKLECTLATYNALINICVRSGDSTRIPGLLEDMAHDNLEPNLVTYSTVLKAYCHDNRMDKAFEMLAELKQSGRYLPDEITYNTVIDGCARNCLYERGIAILKDMEKHGVRPSAYTLSLLVKLAHRCGKVGKAFELCNEISRKYRIQQNVHVYNNLIAACNSTGNTDRALGLFEEMLRAQVRPDARTYTLLLRGCLSSYELQGAAGLIRAALGLRGAHPRTSGCSPAACKPTGGLPAELISEVLQGIAGKGDEVLAVQLLKDVRHVPGIKVDPMLPRWLTSKAVRGA